MPGDIRWSVPLSVKLYQPGTNLLVTAASSTTASDGSFAVTGLPAGTMDVEVKHSQSLSRRAGGLAFFPGGVGGIYRQFAVAMIASLSMLVGYAQCVFALWWKR